MHTMQEIKEKAQDYAEARTDLADRVKMLQELKSSLDKKHGSGITRALLALVQVKTELKEMINVARDLFARPRTQVFSGVKVGLAKGKGKLIIADESKTLKLIAARFTDDEIESMGLIRVYEEPDKDALNKLDAKTLRSIGVTVEESGDQVVVKDVDGEIDKIIKALMKSEEEQAEAA